MTTQDQTLAIVVCWPFALLGVGPLRSTSYPQAESRGHSFGSVMRGTVPSPCRLGRIPRMKHMTQHNERRPKWSLPLSPTEWNRLKFCQESPRPTLRRLRQDVNHQNATGCKCWDCSHALRKVEGSEQ